MSITHGFGRGIRRRATSVGHMDVLAVAVPAVAFIDVTIIGRLILTEIVLLALLPWLWRRHDRRRVPRWFIVLWAGWLASQIVTDVLVGSTFHDYARGWAGIVFTLTNFAGILVLVSTARRARLFAIGLALAGIVGFLVSPHPYAAADPWKWGLAFPVGLLVAASLSGQVARRWPWLTVLAFVVLGLANLAFGYRSLGGISLLTAGYLTLNISAAARGAATVHPGRRAVLGLAFMGISSVAVLCMYSVAASEGWLGQEAQTRYLDQDGAFGTLLGGRSEALVSSRAIIDSPVLGHGSWAKDAYYAELLAEQQESLGYEVTPEYVGADLIPAHSYLMGAWVWAGFLGALFWVAVAAVTLWLLANLYSYRVALAPLLVLSAIVLLWDIAFSPYGHGARIMAPYSLALALLGLSLLRARQEPSPTGGVEIAPSPPRQPSGPPRISVLVPSYNAALYLSEALSSALDQLPPPHEVVVHDGGSTDGTLEVLRSFGTRVSWTSAPDHGQSDGLNRALSRATGDVVIWLNADDTLAPGSLAAASGAFEADPELDFAYGDFDMIDGAGALLRSYRSSAYSWLRVYRRGCYIFSGSLFIRRDVLLALGGLDTSLRACMDLDLLLRLRSTGPSIHLGRTIGRFRIHHASKSSNIGATFVREALRVRSRHAGTSMKLWLLAFWTTLVSAVMQVASPLRYSRFWPRHGRAKTL